MDPVTLQLWSVIGTWVASIGTVSAVITSLWMAYHQGRVKLDVVAGCRQLITQGSSDIPDYCMIKVVNIGNRPAKIVSVSWEAGRLNNKKHLIQMFGLRGFDDVPKMLQEGEEATFMIPFHLNGDKKDWLISFPQYLAEDDPKIISSLKVVVHTSVGQSFKVKAEQGLIDKLKESLEANKSSLQDTSGASASD